MNKIKKLFFILLLIFFIINVIIVILWPIKTNLKFSNFEPYTKEVLQVLNLNKADSKKLYLETWQRERIYEYDQFTGLTESETTNFKFVNISKENGRLVSNNKNNCTNNIFFYGGETMFGYDVTDYQTIPFYFKEKLNDKFNNNKYCVYNFGRSTYFSTQENILFQKHILENKIKKNDILIFLNGINEKGNIEIINTEFISHNYNQLHKKYWNLYKSGFEIFLGTLPSTQFYEILRKKFKKINKISKNDTKKKEKQSEEILKVFNKNIDIRISVCEKFELKCFSFLQPFIDDYGKKSLLKTNNNIIDISNVLNINENVIFIKNQFYSPKSNDLISEKILDIVENKIIY